MKPINEEDLHFLEKVMFNMSIPFARSTRSLQADSYRPTLIGLIISMSLLFLWVIWFLFARIPVSEMSQSIVSIERNIVTVTYSNTAGERIQPGQDAMLHVGDMDNVVEETIPAQVINVDFRARNGQVQVELFALEPLPPGDTPEQSISGAEVVVSTTSPATLVLEAAQQLSN